MSVRVMGLVWAAKLDPTEKLVLLALADHAGHDGERVYPGVELTAWKTGLSERAVQYNIRRLESGGYLVRQSPGTGGRGNRTEYRIDLEKLEPREYVKGAKSAPFSSGERVQDLHRSNEQRVQMTTRKGANDDTKTGATPIKREPSIEPSFSTPNGAKEKRAKRIPEDWTPGDELAAKMREESGFTEARIRKETDLFRDHFLANGKPGKDWDAAFRNWVRRAPEFSKGGRKGAEPAEFETAYEYIARREKSRGLR